MRIKGWEQTRNTSEEITYRPTNPDDWRQGIRIHYNRLKRVWEVAVILDPPEVDIKSFDGKTKALNYARRVMKRNKPGQGHFYEQFVTSNSYCRKCGKRFKVGDKAWFTRSYKQPHIPEFYCLRHKPKRRTDEDGVVKFIGRP